MNLNQLADTWVELVLPTRYRKSGHRSLRSYLDNHVRPTFGLMEVESITLADCERFAVSLEAKGLSVSTRTCILNVLKQVLEAGVRYGHLRDNPCKVSFPEQEKMAMDFHNFVEPASLPALLAAIDDTCDPQMAACLWLQLRLGLRPGEVLGLKREDIDVPNARIVISRKLYEGQEGVTKGSKQVAYSLAGPELDRVRKACLRSSGAFLFDFSPKTLSRWLDKACAKAGLSRITPHGLRHSAGTALAHAGQNAPQIQNFLRHANFKTSEKYIHLSAKDRDDTGSVLGSMLSR